MADESKSTQGSPAKQGAGSRGSQTTALSPTGSQPASNLTIGLSCATAPPLSLNEINSIQVSVGGPCGEKKCCPQVINGQTPGIAQNTNGISFPIAVQSETSLQIGIDVNFTEGSTVSAEPILAYVSCNQPTTVNTIIPRPATSVPDEGSTDVMVHYSWCDSGENEDQENQDLSISQATATMTLDTNNALPSKPAQPIQAAVRDNIAIFSLQKNATYHVSAKIKGAGAGSQSDASFTVPAQGGSQSLSIGIKRPKQAVVLIFLNSQGQLANPGSIFEESLGAINIESNGIATVYPKGAQSLRFLSSSVELSPNTIALKKGSAETEADAEAYIVRFTPIAGAKTKPQELEEEFFVLDGLLAGAIVEVVSMEGALVARLMADSTGTAKFPVDKKDAVYDFKYIHEGRLVDQVRLRASKQPALQSAN